MNICKGYINRRLIKNGRTRHGNQRYKCKESGSSYGEGDRRLKHGLEKRVKVIKMYLKGGSIRSIERLENASSPLIICCIRRFSSLINASLEIKHLNNHDICTKDLI